MLARAARLACPELKTIFVTGIGDSPALLANSRVKLALLALNLSDCDGLDWLEEIGQRASVERALVIAQGFPEIAANRIAGGAVDSFWDYGADSPDNLEFAVNQIVAGGGYMSYGLGELRRRSLQGRAPLNAILSRTEILVFYAIASGADDVAAAELLGMTPSTVKTHRKSISRAFKRSARTELMGEAQLRGIARYTGNGRVVRPGFYAAMSEHLRRRQARLKTGHPEPFTTVPAEAGFIESIERRP